METEVDEKYLGALAFVENTPKEDLARFITQQAEAVNGLNRNNSDFIETFRKMSAENARLRTALEQLADDKDATDRIQTVIDVLNDHDMYEEANNLKVKTNADEH